VNAKEGNLKKRFLVSLLFLAACAPGPSGELASPPNNKEKDKQIEVQVIYGDDNRLENYQASEALKSLAASTVALVKSSSLVVDAATGKSRLNGELFGDAYQLCASEPFREQTSGAFCSGSLVGPDTIITAGHCVTSATDCSNVRFVFDFALQAPGVENKLFSADQIYRCAQLIKRDQVSSGADYAVIKLDRSVVGRNALKYRRSGVVAVGDQVLVIGHPAGLPQKIAGGAQVRSISSQHFVTNLDTYGGNSGSAVFNASTSEIEGILVRGENDFISSGSCNVSNRCASGSCRGEDVTRIDQVVPHLGTVDPPPPPPPPMSDLVFAVSPNLSIPDSPKAGVKSSVSASSAVGGRKVRVQIELKHTYRGDLLVELLAPSGKVLILHNRSGGSLDDLRGTYGLDLASAQSLETLSSEPAGKWSLQVTDKASKDVGTLLKWSLILAAK
jgi:subtilisin-like proprotein convertase family protein/V8-like Glu-specific endopeptidase